MIKQIEHHFCDLCNVDLGTEAEGHLHCKICSREICRENYCHYWINLGRSRRYSICIHCETILQEEPRVQEALDKMFKTWGLLSTKARDLQKLP